MNLSTEKKIMDLENRVAVAKGGRGGSGVDGKLGVYRCKLLPVEWLAVRSCCVALGTMSSHLWWSMIMWEKRMYTCMCNWDTMLYSRKLTDHCKPAIMEKNKNHYIKNKIK